MFCEEYGKPDAPRLLLLHCAAVTPMFDPAVAYLADQYHLLVPHLMGSGSRTAQTFRFGESLLELQQLCEEQRPLGVVGHSLGANLVLGLLSRCPHSFVAAVISSPMVDASDRVAHWKGMVVKTSYGLLRSRRVARAYADALTLADERRAFLLEYWPKISKETWKNYYIDRFTAKRFGRPGGYGVPVTVAWGSKEPKVVRNTVKALLRRDPIWQEVVLPGAGHDHPIRDPEGFARLVDRAFRSSQESIEEQAE